MYLKNLEIVGFKSFAEKTRLDFLPGVTAIVGPNGCGKSNVSDSLRWVLGEQSAKALRGGEMADVIFNGTDGRRPIGMAEVSITIAEIKPGELSPVAGVQLDYGEVKITRRVFRNGEGNYFINQTPVRLRDVQQLFMDTGIGRAAYSMMEQGRIDQILSSHPEDRRAIFEEAAGITKFKTQKKEALRKLEYTEANLVRVTDIIREVKRQIGSLQRQAGKARRYKELHDQLRSLDCRLSRHRLDELEAAVAEFQTKIAALDATIAAATSAVEQSETAVAGQRQGQESLDHAVAQTTLEQQENRSEIERNQSRIQFNNERISEFDALIQKHSVDIGVAEQRAADQRAALAVLEEQLKAMAAVVAEKNAALKAEQEAVAALDQQLVEAEKTVAQTDAAIIEQESNASRLRSELASIDIQQRNSSLRLERLGTEKSELQQRASRIQVTRDAGEQELIGRRATIGKFQEEIAQFEQALAQANTEMKQLSAAASAELRSIAEVNSKLELLNQLERDYEGYSAGSLAVLRNTHGAEVPPDALLNALAQCIQVDPQFAPAVEAALGSHLQAIVVRDSASAEKIIAALHERQLGRAALAPLDLPRVIAPSLDMMLEGAIGFAIDHVRCDEALKPLVRSLLASVVIAPDLQTALQIISRSNGVEAVTPRGEFVNRHGVISGGAGVAAGILTRKSQIAELTETLARLQSQATQTEARQQASVNEAVRVEEKLAATRRLVHTAELQIATQEGELASVEKELVELGHKTETVTWELEQLSHQGTGDAERKSQIQQELSAIEQRESELRRQLGAERQNATQLQADRQHRLDELTEAKIAQATEQQRYNNANAGRAPLEARIAEFTDLIEARQRDRADYTERIVRLRAEITEADQAVATCAVRRDELQRQLREQQEQRHAFALRIAELEESVRVQRRQIDEARTEHNTIDLQLAEKRMAMQNLKERIARQYQLNLDELPPEVLKITIADTGQPQTTTLTPEETAAAGLGPDWAAMEMQVTEMQQRLDAMGPVNLEAIAEYDELEQRQKFLSEQHEDLVKSKDDLLKAIAHINTTTRKLFSETFERIRTNFQEMYGELFGGGKANLILLDENDPLESGIEIVARPPGKQLTSITLLSGGEKTMTAVALLFAIYMVKPSPFCVLDEMDAPLDESNINRFLNILRRFLKQSQFVLITHNKRTIAMADVLYGVTMQESGVSKIVSVKFTRRAEDHGDAQPLDHYEGDSTMETTKADVTPAPAPVTAPIMPEAQQPVATAVSEPVAEPAAEPVAESAASAAEPVAPVTESVAPVAEPAASTEPVAPPPIEPPAPTA
ncbi:MAG: chromosome segregation protein SMC [Verrucomicrobia bacterium]|nr:chromosome segregation protein SMC [Verrucomicrobiota bacterium]